LWGSFWFALLAVIAAVAAIALAIFLIAWAIAPSLN
jgi:hypothetical protein